MCFGGEIYRGQPAGAASGIGVDPQPGQQWPRWAAARSAAVLTLGPRPPPQEVAANPEALSEEVIRRKLEEVAAAEFGPMVGADEGAGPTVSPFSNAPPAGSTVVTFDREGSSGLGARNF